MKIRTYCAATLALAALSANAFAQAPAPAPVATQSSENTSETHTTTVTNPDGTSASKTDASQSEVNKSSTTTVAPAPGAPAAITWAVMPPEDQHIGVIPWSAANTRITARETGAPGLYIWHDKNTVYVTASGGGQGRHTFSGALEIDGGKPRFDTLKSIEAGGDDHFNIEGENRVAFHLSTDHHRDTFKFNLRDGERLRVYTLLDGQPTQNVYFGAALAQARSVPVVFDLNR